MRMTRIALLAATVLATACSSNETTAPAPITIETRLAAAAAVPIASLSDANVTMRVAVTSALTETVSGGVCAQIIEARLPAASSWTDVTSSSGVCSANAIMLAPGGTININAIADQAKARGVAGSGTSLVLRARHTLAGASANYILQSNEVTWQLP
jgi:hypothetical protein